MLKPCKNPLCNNYAEGNSKYCKEHKKEKARYYAQKARDEKRINPFYQTKEWKQTRKLKLLQNPMCEACLKAGISNIANEVDHITPIEEGGAKLDMANLQSLCKPCHSRKTGQEQKKDRLFKEKHDTEIILVCGPPAAGKTSYVKQHMVYGDLVIDLDSIIQALSGQELYDKPDSIVSVAVAIRTKILEASMGLVARAWVISSGATQEARSKALGSITADRVIVLKPSRQEALAKAFNRKNFKLWEGLINEWYEKTDL